jgi:tRNA pseudouridine55 synthase
MQGLLSVDKPSGISSFGVVAIVRKTITKNTGEKVKVGHTGTLDPLATGLLVLAIGKYTKLVPQIIKNNKIYQVTMKIGQKSSTGDKEGDIVDVSGRRPSVEEVKKALDNYKGDILQTPPAYSAIKVGGQRAYKLARAGKTVELKPRKVRINSIRLIAYKYPNIQFLTEVSSGTYIRSLVEDIGDFLKTGAYMSLLRRTQIGRFDIGESIKLDDISYSKISKHLITLEK